MKTPTLRSTLRWTGATTLGLALAACSLNETGDLAAGQADTGAPLAGSVTLVDSSVPTQARSAPTGADGAFAVKVSGLQPPYLLRVGWTAPGGDRWLYGISAGDENVDVNGLTDFAYAGACAGEPEERVFSTSDPARKRAAAAEARARLTALGARLAPLFQRYGIADPVADRDAVRRLMQDVQVERVGGLVTVTTRATGGLVYQGPLADLASGTFHPGALPPGPPGQPCTSFEYSEFGACRPGGLQLRAVLASLPPACVGGAPELARTCVYVPPVVACTSFSYGPYGACQPDGTQARALVAALPAGCTGTAPLLTRACVYVPPVVACTSFSYGPYGACRPDGTQARALVAALPAGCTGGAPVLVGACVYLPPLDGAALYAQYCAGCHKNKKKGSPAAAIQRAIDQDVGDMGALKGLTPAEIAAISAAR